MHGIRRHRLPSGAIRAGIAQEVTQRLWKSGNPDFAEAGSGRQRRCAGLEGGQEPTNCDRPARQWTGIPAFDDCRANGRRRRRQRQPGDQRTERTMAGAGGHRRRQVAWAADDLIGGLTARPGLIHIIVGRIDLDRRQPAGRADQQRSRLVGADCARDRRHPAPSDDLQQKRSHPGHKAEPPPPPHCPPSGRHVPCRLCHPPDNPARRAKYRRLRSGTSGKCTHRRRKVQPRVRGAGQASRRKTDSGRDSRLRRNASTVASSRAARGTATGTSATTRPGDGASSRRRSASARASRRL